MVFAVGRDPCTGELAKGKDGEEEIVGEYNTVVFAVGRDPCTGKGFLT